jgi:hypothetical protein
MRSMGLAGRDMLLDSRPHRHQRATRVFASPRSDSCYDPGGLCVGGGLWFRRMRRVLLQSICTLPLPVLPQFARAATGAPISPRLDHILNVMAFESLVSWNHGVFSLCENPRPPARRRVHTAVRRPLGQRRCTCQGVGSTGDAANFVCISARHDFRYYD